MPLSEADFYAYSRATGTPVPRDAQERAEIAPQVLGFRQGQLSATKEELDRGNFIDMAGKTALVAGLGAGAAALATGGRFGKLRGALANVVRPKDAGATTGVRTVDLNKTNIPVEKVYVQDVTPSAVAMRSTPTVKTGDVVDIPARSFDPPDERMGQLFKSLEQAIPEPSERELARAIPFDRPVKSKEEAYSAAVQRRPISSAAEQEYIPGIEDQSQSKEVYLSQSQQQRQDLENLRASRGDTQLELKGPEFKSNISQLLKDSEQEAIFPVQNLYKTTSSQAAIDFSPRSYLESTGAVAPGPSSALRKGRDPVDVLLDEREAAEIRRIRQADRAQEAKVIGKGERLLAELQAEKPQVSSWPEISGKLKQLDVSISGAPEAQGGSGIDLTFGTKVGDREFNLYSPQSQQMLEKVGLTANQVEEGWVSNLKSKGILESSSPSTLVEQQNARRPLVSEQSVEAVDTGADQVFGRVMEDVQRNEDLSISSAATYLNNRRDEIASMLGEQGLAVTPGRIEEALGYEFGPKAYTFGPKQTQRKQSLQLGATYNTNFFENLKTPSVQVAGKTIPTSSLKQPTVMEETAKRLEERVNKAKTRIGDVALEQQMREVRFQQGQKQLGELGAYAQELKNFAQTTTDPLLADRAMGRRSDVLLEYDMLENRLNQSLGALEGGRRGEAKFRQKVGESISEMEPPARLKPGIEEGQRIFFEQDPTTLNPTFGTQKIVSERKMIDTETKGGGGRKVAEYTGGASMGDVEIDLDAAISNVQTKQDPREYSPDQFASDYSYKQQFSDPADRRRWTGDRTQTGREIDQYGIRLSTQKGADPGLKPSTPRYTQAEIEEAALALSRWDPETGVPIPPRREAVIQSMGKQRKTPEGRAAIDVSRRLTALQRQANQGNPRAQAELKSFIQNMRG